MNIANAVMTWKDSITEWLDNPEPLNLDRGHEYAAYIMNALVGGEMFEFNGNVPNTKLITNLPDDVCVEVPVFVDKAGLHPVHVGRFTASVRTAESNHRGD